MTKQVPVGQITALEDAIKLSRNHPDWLFRGHPESIGDEPLLPLIFRTEFTKQFSNYPEPPGAVEAMLATWFKDAAPSVFDTCPEPDDYIGWLALMQHFRAPTRLLDWTESAFVALFFAIEDDTDNKPSKIDGQIIVMDGHELTKRVRTHHDPNQNGSWSVGQAMQQLAAQAQTDRRFWSGKGLTDADLCRYPLPFQPPLSFRRISQQRGWFTIHPRPGNDDSRIESVLTGIGVKRLTIPVHSKNRIRRDLEKLGVSHATLFPDLEGLSKSLVPRLQRWFEYSGPTASL